MEPPRVQVSIAFEGSANCWKDAHACAIDVSGPKTELYAQSVGKSDSKLYEGPLKWSVPNTDKIRPFFQTRKDVDVISLPSAVVKTMTLSARVIETYENHRHLTVHPDGTTTPELRARRHNVPITIANQSDVEAGKSYLIKIINIGARTLKAEFIKRDPCLPTEPKPLAPPPPEESVEEMVRRNFLGTHASEKTISAVAKKTASLLSSLKAISAESLRGVPMRAPDSAAQATASHPTTPSAAPSVAARAADSFTELGAAFSGLLSMKEKFVSSHADGAPELDDLSAEELKRLFEAKKNEFIKARTAFDRACSDGDPFSALAHKQEVSKDLIALEAALNRKGVFFSSPL